jgi:hypothetical protein
LSKRYEDEDDESLRYILGTGFVGTWQPAPPKTDKKVKPQIGFVRQKMAKPTYKPKPRPKK